MLTDQLVKPAVGSESYACSPIGRLALVARLSDDLREGKPLPVFKPLDTDEQAADADNNLNLIGSVGGTNHDGMINAIMLGLSPDPERPIVTFSLVYVDPDQFLSADAASASSSS